MCACVYVYFVPYLYVLCLFCGGYNCNMCITPDQNFTLFVFELAKKALMTAMHGNLKCTEAEGGHPIPILLSIIQ